MLNPLHSNMLPLFLIYAIKSKITISNRIELSFENRSLPSIFNLVHVQRCFCITHNCPLNYFVIIPPSLSACQVVTEEIIYLNTLLAAKLAPGIGLLVCLLVC